MAIFKIHKDSNFTVLDNGMFKDRELSLKSLGLLCKMLSLPEDWNFTMAGLASISKESIGAVKTALDELQRLGYVKIMKKFPNETESGKIEYEYNVFEVKQQKQPPENQGLENQPLEVQGLENPRQVNTNIERTKKENKENKNNIVQETSTPQNKNAAAVIARLNERAGTRYRASKSSMQPIVARLNEGFSVEELFTVIDYKCSEWKGTEMQKYLRPETLFRPSKFEGYLNAALSGAPIRSAGRVCADSCVNKADGKAFKDLTATEQKSKLSGVKF